MLYKNKASNYNAVMPQQRLRKQQRLSQYGRRKGTGLKNTTNIMEAVLWYKHVFMPLD